MQAIRTRRSHALLGTKSIDTALAILEEGLTTRREHRVSEIAAALDIPVATAYRQLAALKRHGLIRRASNGHFAPGVFLLWLLDREGFKRLLARIARPILVPLATDMQVTVHLGVLEGNMVTYLIKAQPEEYGLFSRENTQLDAYCSAVGKVLLAGLPDNQLESYLADGDLIPLTQNTISDAQCLHKELVRIRKRGFATDNEEFENGLFCVSVPVRSPDNRLLAAVSISSYCRTLVKERRAEALRILSGVSAEISKGLYGESKHSLDG